MIYTNTFFFFFGRIWHANIFFSFLVEYDMLTFFFFFWVEYDMLPYKQGKLQQETDCATLGGPTNQQNIT